MPSRVSPTEKIRGEIDALFGSGRDLAEVLEDVARLGARLIMQAAVEAEVDQFLGRARYQRRAEVPDARPGSRNGYCPTTVKTTAGPVTVARPKLRGTDERFVSRLFGTGVCKTNALETLVIAGFVRGLSTRDVEDAFRDATGELLISKSAVSEITDRLWEDYQAFISRDLSEIAVEYLFVDAIFESLRRHGAKEALLVAWCIASDGRKHLLHLAVGNKESQACWMEFFRSMLGRGLRAPTTVTSDGAPEAGLATRSRSDGARTATPRTSYRLPSWLAIQSRQRWRSAGAISWVASSRSLLETAAT